jgi:hypothetical protein
MAFVQLRNSLTSRHENSPRLPRPKNYVESEADTQISAVLDNLDRPPLRGAVAFLAKKFR